MRYDDDRALVFPQRVLQPLRRFQIEMVGRLVQHEQLGLHEQYPRQTQPRLFAAGKQARGLLAPLPGKAQSGQHALYAAGPLVAAGLLEAIGQSGVFAAQALEQIGVFVVLRHLPLEIAQLFLHTLQRLEHARKLLHHGQLGGDVGLLSEQPHPRAAQQTHRAAVGRHIAGNDLHQRRFAAAVHAHQAEPLPLLEREINILQYDVQAKRLANVLQCQKHHFRLRSREL